MNGLLWFTAQAVCLFWAIIAKWAVFIKGDRVYSMKHILSACLVAVFSLGLSVPARADYFVWTDAKTGLFLSFPDTWKVMNSRLPDEVLTIMAPDAEDFAVCRVRTDPDRRFLMYPPTKDSDVQKVAYSTEFWDKYYSVYDDVEIYGVVDNAGLGRGFASIAVADFKSDFVGPYMKRRGVATAALYNDTAFMIDCSAREGRFAKWHDLFQSVMASVDFKKTHHELLTGEYRNFLNDARMNFQWPGSDATNRY